MIPSGRTTVAHFQGTNGIDSSDFYASITNSTGTGFIQYNNWADLGGTTLENSVSLPEFSYPKVGLFVF